MDSDRGAGAQGAVSALLVSRSGILPVNPRVSKLKNNGPSPIANRRDRAITRKRRKRDPTLHRRRFSDDPRPHGGVAPRARPTPRREYEAGPEGRQRLSHSVAGFSAVFFNGFLYPETQPARRIFGQELSSGWIPYRSAVKPPTLTLPPLRPSGYPRGGRGSRQRVRGRLPGSCCAGSVGSERGGVRPGAQPRHDHDFDHAGEHHAGRRQHDPQCRPTAYPREPIGLTGPDRLGVDLLYRLRRDHDASDRLARRPVRHQANFSDLGHRFYARIGAVRRRHKPL